MTPLNQTSAPSVRFTVQAEAALVTGLALWAYGQTSAGWGFFAALLLAPDLFMLGYLAGPRIGAACYNLGHSYLTPAVLWGLGQAMGGDVPQSLALIWVAHIGLDRCLGYGLKYPQGFRQTHLQRL